ncbi:MAG: zinc ABC transporter substrate-binding protein [Eubacteriales bacterium]|nr:zinc ABC transporter substrate-binding protein [Eubacteriales bacterium]
MLIVLSLCLIGLSASAVAEETGKMSIAVSIVPQKTFVEAVAGDLADVVIMIPAGSSPENYEPTPMEMETFSKASVYFTIGVPTETANILPQAADTGVTIVDLPSIVAAQYADRTFADGSRDPHIWLSPKRVIVMVNAIADTLSDLDPENAATYSANAAAYVEKLTELDQTMAETLDTMTKKEFIVFHPAYGYLAEDYGLAMYAMEEEGKESTPQDIAKLIDFAKAEGITTIFSQAEIDSRQPDSFAEEIGGQKVLLAPLAANYLENMESMANAIAASMQ